MDNFHELLFNSFIILTYILYIVAYLNIKIYNPDYITVLHTIMKYYVSGLLLIKFNPFITPTFTSFDRRLIFSSAVLLFTSTIFDNYTDNLTIFGLPIK
jgi:hypothetical protein